MKGIPVSEGIAIGKIFKIEQVKLKFSSKIIKDVDAEIEKYNNARKIANDELEEIREKTRINIDEEHAEIFTAHIMMLNDPTLEASIVGKITNDKIDAASAVKDASNEMIAIFESMTDNAYMMERAADIKDVRNRVLAHLLGLKINDPSKIAEECIVIAHDLTPSDTAGLNKKFVKGFITEIGGKTSHSAIMARTLELPAISGCGSFLSDVKHGEMVILDGLTGNVIINPSNDELKEYEKKQAEFEKERKELHLFKDKKSVSKDGFVVEIAANIGTAEDVPSVLKNGAEGIGLFRTEFLYMNRNDFPTEEEQFEAYKTVLEGMEGKPVVIRTLDIGGDKELTYLPMEKEMNPFLGYRAVRLCLGKPELFKTQLRALLRASVYGNLKIMFPMIATVDEFRSAKKMFDDCKQELIEEGQKVCDDIEVGIMVEIPAAAVNADMLGREVDFFSIGTNDLIQYSMAADRMNENVSYLYQPLNPAIIKLIKMTIDAANKNNIWCGMCGEVAGDATVTAILLGLGLHEYSMSVSSVLKIRRLISTYDKKDCEKMVNEILETAVNEADVEKILKKYL